MSWTLLIPASPPEDFNAAVDATEATGQDISIPGVAQAVEVARATLKALAPVITRPLIEGYACGHVLTESQGGPNWDEGVTVSVGWDEGVTVSVGGWPDPAV